MGTQSFRFVFLLFLASRTNHYLNARKEKIILNHLLTHSSYPSIHFALQQIQSISSNVQLTLNSTDEVIPCDVGTSVKLLFDLINRTTTSSNVLITEACQNVLSSIAEAVTYFQLPVFSFTDSDLSLSSIDRYPYLYHIVPSDRAHNIVRKQLLQYFNWTRFGLIYQHGAKYTLIANDLSNLTAMDRKQWDVNLTRGIAYRPGLAWAEENAKNMKGLLRDFKAKDVRIIIASFNQTLAAHMFCHAARERIYGSRYQWIILGYPSVLAWWNERTDCSRQELIRAINGTLQTRIPRLSMEDFEDRPTHVLDYFEQFASLERSYFDAYAYDTIWSLAYLYQTKNRLEQSSIKEIIENLDFIGATGRVRYSNGERIGEVLVEQYVACRMMPDGSCQIPCYSEEIHCNLTVVKVFLAKTLESKEEPPVLLKQTSVLWHGTSPPRDRTKRIVRFEHIYLSVFVSISICSGLGLMISVFLFAFNIHFQTHRYIRMSSPTLNNIILAGCMLAYIAIILMGINSSLFPKKFFVEVLMNIVCATRAWFLCISFTLAFGSMFSKTWRVHSIFTNINSLKKGIHDSFLLTVVGALLCIDLFYLIAWQIFDPIKRKLVSDAPYRPAYNQDMEIQPYREECKGEYTTYWCLVLLIYKGILMLYGLFLSWTTRHVTIPALNDSRYIGLSVYIVFICSTLGSLVAFIPSEQIQLSYFLISFFIVLCTTGTVALVFVPKIIEVYQDPYSKKKQPRMANRLQVYDQRSAMLTYKHLNNAIIDNQQLNLVYAMQEQTLNHLMEQLSECVMRKESFTEAFEMERLMVPNDEEEEEEEEEDNGYEIFIKPNKPFQGHVARAVSLCLYNKIHTAQIHWPETTGGLIRRATSQLDEHFASSPISKSRSADEAREQTTHLLEPSSSHDHFETVYDGLLALDEAQLSTLTETDFISSPV